MIGIAMTTNGPKSRRTESEIKIYQRFRRTSSEYFKINKYPGRKCSTIIKTKQNKKKNRFDVK